MSSLFDYINNIINDNPTNPINPDLIDPIFLCEQIKINNIDEVCHIFSNINTSYSNIYLLSEVFSNWYIHTTNELQIEFLKNLFSSVNLKSPFIKFNIFIILLQKILGNNKISDKIIIQSFQECNRKSIDLLLFINSHRKLNYNDTGYKSKYTLLETTAIKIFTISRNIVNDDEYEIFEMTKILNYLLKNTNTHVNEINLYAIMADIYNSFNNLNISTKFINTFFIENSQCIDKWTNVLDFFNTLKTLNYSESETVKKLIKHFDKDFSKENNSFIYMNDIFNQSLLSYANTKEQLQILLDCDWIPECIKKEYKENTFSNIKDFNCQIVNKAFYNKQLFEKSIDKMHIVHFFPISVPIENVNEKDILIKINQKTREKFFEITRNIFTKDLSNIIYNKVI